jgi:hypothetical protein
MAILIWLMIEMLLCRVLPRLEPYLPDDICGPGGWFSDTANQSGIFDRPRRQG